MDGHASLSWAYTLPTGTTCGHITGDGAGKIYQVALGARKADITVLVLNANAGTLTLERSFTNSLASSDYVTAADTFGNFYAQDASNVLIKFGPRASGAAVPDWKLPMNAQLWDMATDTSGNLYASSGQKVLQFPFGFTTATPSKTMDISAHFARVNGIALDRCNNIAVLGNPGQTSDVAISFFPPIVDGPAAPTRTIQTGSFVLDPSDLFLDSTGASTAVDNDSVHTPITLTRYAPGASGAVTPMNHISEGLGANNVHRHVLY